MKYSSTIQISEPSNVLSRPSPSWSRCVCLNNTCFSRHLWQYTGWRLSRYLADIRYSVDAQFGECHGKKSMTFGRASKCAKTDETRVIKQSCTLAFLSTSILQVDNEIKHSTFVFGLYNFSYNDYNWVEVVGNYRNNTRHFRKHLICGNLFPEAYAGKIGKK